MCSGIRTDGPSIGSSRIYSGPSGARWISEIRPTACRSASVGSFRSLGQVRKYVRDIKRERLRGEAHELSVSRADL